MNIIQSLNLHSLFRGQTASPNSYPWLSALGYNITNTTTKISTTQFLCGSTLITQRHLVSAAHCIISTLLLARLGAYDITQKADGVATIDAYVVSTYVHELYDAKKITNDISIIKLDRTLPITTAIRPICIPYNDAMRYKDITGLMAWVVS
jgi:secreted trypsin-like serine protease